MVGGGGWSAGGGPRRDLKSFLEAARFILAEYEPVGSHGDPVHDKFEVRTRDTHFVSKLSDFEPTKNDLLHMDAEIKLRCTK